MYGEQRPGSCGAEGLFVDSMLRLTGTTATQMELGTTVTVDGYQPDEQPPVGLFLQVGPDGARYASGLHVTLEYSPATNLAGARATVVFQAQADWCTSLTANTVQLAY